MNYFPEEELTYLYIASMFVLGISLIFGYYALVVGALLAIAVTSVLLV